MRTGSAVAEARASGDAAPARAGAAPAGAAPAGTRAALGGGALAGLAEAVLERGGALRFTARGRSMAPYLLDGDVVRVEPVASDAVRLGDVVLYRDGGGRVVLHRVVGPARLAAGPPAVLAPPALRAGGRRGFLVRGDAHAAGGERVGAERVLGRMVSFERRGVHHTSPAGVARIRLLGRVWAGAVRARLRSWGRPLRPRPWSAGPRGGVH